MLSFLNNIVTSVSNFFSGDVELKKIKDEARIKIEEAKTTLKIEQIKAQSKQLEAVTDWDSIVLHNMRTSYKDEILMFIFIFPFLGAFIPFFQEPILRGFEIISKLPYWYMLILIGIVSSTFGLRWLFSRNFKKINKGM